MAEEAPKAEGPPEELEGDAPPPPKGARRVSECPGFRTQDSTLNCVFSSHGNILMPLTDGGLQLLLAGARSNIGVKAGRYYFEAKVLELMSPAEDSVARQRSSQPKNQLCLGVAVEGASLFLGDDEGSVCFDMAGACIHKGNKESCSQSFGQGDVVGLLLNLDSASPNAETISLFKNGVRASQPRPLPDCLKGKALYPAFTFKNVSFHYNLGPQPLVALPFSCNMLSNAYAQDVALLAPVAKKQKQSQSQSVVFPVCLPEEGPFDWLDQFLESNKDFAELSDRAILSWVQRSGYSPAKASPKASNDKPETAFGIPMLDDGSIRRVLNAVAPVHSRNYVVMEVKGNLLKEERKQLLARWPASGFKRKAVVLMGEPPAAFKKRAQELNLQAKQEASDAAFQAKQAEEKKKKALEQRQKQLERDRKKAAKATKKKQEALRRKIEEERRKKMAEKGEEVEVDEGKEAEAAEEPESEEEKEEEAPEEPEESPPKVELTAEERKQFFRKTGTPDITAYALSTSFVKFSVPEQDEGFDEVEFGWSKDKEAKCKEYLHQWIRERKLTTRIEDLEPSEWFNDKWEDWKKTVQGWHAKQNMHKAALAKKAAEAAAKEAKKKAAAEAAAKAKEAKEAKGAEEAEADGDAGEKKQPEAEAEEAEEPTPVVDFNKVDVFGVEDVTDIGGGQPLFSAFAFEDWAMLSLRFELYIMTHAFRRDAKDPDRAGIPLDHLAFYYSKYFKKALNAQMYGVESLKELLEKVKDTVLVCGPNLVMQAMIPEDVDSFGIFAMITEEARRYRGRRLSLGDESAALKVTQQTNAGAGALAAAAAAAAAGAAGAAGLGLATGGLGPRPAGGRPLQGHVAGGQPQVTTVLAAQGQLPPGAGGIRPGVAMAARPPGLGRPAAPVAAAGALRPAGTLAWQRPMAAPYANGAAAGVYQAGGAATARPAWWYGR